MFIILVKTQSSEHLHVHVHLYICICVPGRGQYNLLQVKLENRKLTEQLNKVINTCTWTLLHAEYANCSVEHTIKLTIYWNVIFSSWDQHSLWCRDYGIFLLWAGWDVVCPLPYCTVLSCACEKAGLLTTTRFITIWP